MATVHSGNFPRLSVYFCARSWGPSKLVQKLEWFDWPAVHGVVLPKTPGLVPVALSQGWDPASL